MLEGAEREGWLGTEILFLRLPFPPNFKTQQLLFKMSLPFHPTLLPRFSVFARKKILLTSERQEKNTGEIRKRTWIKILANA